MTLCLLAHENFINECARLGAPDSPGSGGGVSDRTDYTMLPACLFFLIVGAGRWSADVCLGGVAGPHREGERPERVA